MSQLSNFFFTMEQFQKVSKNDNKQPEISQMYFKSIKKCQKVSKSIKKYQKISKSIKNYRKVPKESIKK